MSSGRRSGCPGPPTTSSTSRRPSRTRDGAATRPTRSTCVRAARKNVLEEEISDLAEKLKKYQQQLPSVKTNREYGALLNELDAVKREIRTREDEILGLEENARGLLGRGRRARGFLPGGRGGLRGTDEGVARRAGRPSRRRSRPPRRRRAPSRRRSTKCCFAASGRSPADVAAWRSPASPWSGRRRPRARPATSASVRSSSRTSGSPKRPIICDSCKRILYWDGGE